MANLFQPSIIRVTDSHGHPISGAKGYYYLTGTTTAAIYYLNQEGTIEGTNPQVSDADGKFAPVYLDTATTYRIKVTDSDGSETVFDVDPVRGYDEGMVQTASAAAIAAAAEALESATEAENARVEAETSANEAEASAAAALESEETAGLYAEAAAAAGGIFPDTAAGLAATASGSNFLVQGTPGGTVLAKLYRDNAGVADDLDLEMASLAAFEGLVSEAGLSILSIVSIPLEYHPTNMVLILDGNGHDHLLQWLYDGVFHGGGGGGALENIGDGAGIYSGVSAEGSAQLRSLEGDEGISVAVSGDGLKLTITYDGDSATLPTEFWLVIVLGQSNATETDGDAAEATALPEGVGLHFQQGPSRLSDLSSTDDGGWRASFMPAFAKQVWAKTGRGVIFINKAVGGTAMIAAADTGAGNWSGTGTLRNTAETALTAAQTFLDALPDDYPYQLACVVLCQGERDAQGIDDAMAGVNQTTHKAGLVDFCAWVATAFGDKAPLLISETGRPLSGDTAGFTAVRVNEREVEEEVANVFAGFTGARRLAADGMMGSELHYDQDGKNRMGTHLGSAAVSIAAGIRSA